MTLLDTARHRRRLKSCQSRLLVLDADRIDIIVEVRLRSGTERIARKVIDPSDLGDTDPAALVADLAETVTAAAERAEQRGP